ncbi:hypothetical protein M0R45_007564 [Rubus argutus]|uniref:RING-type E3 ubiquitin transferase n=1 Tax=Rubus argutus TaxID=59490 RepID=A0AAW1XZI6_RUBAR
MVRLSRPLCDIEDDEDNGGSSRPVPKRARRDFPSMTSWRVVQQSEHDGSEEEYEEDDDELDCQEDDEEGEYEEQEYQDEYDNDNDDDVDIEDEEEEPNYEPISDDPINVTLNDPGVLDCPICCETLTIPIFQCDNNGHIACSSCSSKIHQCPSCSSPFGSSRCRAIEKVLESSTTSCRNSKYGCKETMTYDKKREHEKECMHLPCSCPHSGCDFVASRKNLYKHFDTDHVNSATRFMYYSDFSITLKKNEKFLVLQEKDEGTIFILKNCVVEGVGNAVKLCCLQPSFMRESYYKLVAKTKGNVLSLQSSTKSRPRQVYGGPPSKDSFLLIPLDFFRLSDQLKINLSVWPNGVNPPVV